MAQLDAETVVGVQQAVLALTAHHDSALAAGAAVASELLQQPGALASAGLAHSLEVLLEPLLQAVMSGSPPAMALALPAAHRLLPHAASAVRTSGFVFLVTVIEALADGISVGLGLHGVTPLLHELLDALSLALSMASPQHLSRETLGMLVLALFRLALRASASPVNTAAAGPPLSGLRAPAEAVLHRLGELTCGWLSSSVDAAPSGRRPTVDWSDIEDSLAGFLAAPPSGTELLGETIMEDSQLERWLLALGHGAAAARPALLLVAALAKLMIHEMPEPAVLGRAGIVRQRALAVQTFTALLSDHPSLAEHPVALQVCRRHGMTGMLHAVTIAAGDGGEPFDSPPVPTAVPGVAIANAEKELLSALSAAMLRLCGSSWLSGALGEELGAMLAALSAVTLAPPAASEAAPHAVLAVETLRAVALSELWLPLMSQLNRHSGEAADTLALMSLFALHDLPHAEGSRLFGEPSALVASAFEALCALVEYGPLPGETTGVVSGCVWRAAYHC